MTARGTLVETIRGALLSNAVHRLPPERVVADLILTSDWLAEVKREAKAEALREAASRLRAENKTGDEWYAQWLDEQAEQIVPVKVATLRTWIEELAEAWDEGAQAGLDAGLTIAENVHANGGVLDLASVPGAPINPYRKEQS